MKNLIAIDTSTEACSVALLCDEQSIFRYLVEPRVHAKVLLPLLDELLAEAGISAQQIDAIAFGRGPGAFTGVRIGTAAAQAIALASDLPVAPVSTLAAIAHRCFRERGCEKVAACIDARMGEVYWGAYQLAFGQAELVGAELVCPPAKVKVLDASWTSAGTGWQTYPSELQRASGVSIDASNELFPHALDILHLGRSLLQRGQGVSADKALPVYLRDNVALTEKQRSQN